MPWVREEGCTCNCPEVLEEDAVLVAEDGTEVRVSEWEKDESHECPHGCTYWWDEEKPWAAEDNPNAEEGSLEKSRWQKTKMEWYVLGKNVICSKCYQRMPNKAKPRAIKLEKVQDGIVCAKCGAAPLSVRKGAVVLLEAGEKVYCPTCAKERESVLLQKAVMVASLEDEDVAPAPLWCDGCGEPIPVAISDEAATVLHKTIEGLETIIFDKNLRDIRPSLWRRALEWKEKLEGYLLKADVYKKSRKAAS